MCVGHRRNGGTKPLSLEWTAGSTTLQARTSQPVSVLKMSQANRLVTQSAFSWCAPVA